MSFTEFLGKHAEDIDKTFPNLSANESNALSVYLYEFWKAGREEGIEIGRLKYEPPKKIEPDDDIDHTTGYYLSNH